MSSSPDPAGPGRPPAAPAAGEAEWVACADTRQEAQEADAGMARDEWEYAPVGLDSPALPVAESEYFLP